MAQDSRPFTSRDLGHGRDGLVDDRSAEDSEGPELQLRAFWAPGVSEAMTLTTSGNPCPENGGMGSGVVGRLSAFQLPAMRGDLREVGVDAKAIAPRPSIVDPFVPFLVSQLEKYPRLRASRLFTMIKDRGYPGGPDHLRRVVGRLRPGKPAEAFQRLRTLPGEQAQVDWAHFGKLQIGRAQRALWAFVMVLSYSRRIFLRFIPGAAMPFFLGGHVDAFAAFGSVPRVLLYDNLKSAVLERRGDAIRFHPMLLELAAHYCFEPRPVAIARGNEKGRVERAIRYIRDPSSHGRGVRRPRDHARCRRQRHRCHAPAVLGPRPADRASRSSKASPRRSAALARHLRHAEGAEDAMTTPQAPEMKASLKTLGLFGLALPSIRSPTSRGSPRSAPGRTRPKATTHRHRPTPAHLHKP